MYGRTHQTVRCAALGLTGFSHMTSGFLANHNDHTVGWIDYNYVPSAPTRGLTGVFDDISDLFSGC